MEDYIENDEEGNIFELIAEECYYEWIKGGILKWVIWVYTI